MNKKFFSILAASLAILAVMSACGNKADTGNANTANEGTVTEAPASNPPSNNAGDTASATPDQTDSSTPAEESAAPNADASPNSDNADGEILIIIDQTEKPIEGNSFDFSVKKGKEGYSLSELEWKSDKTTVTNTIQEAIEHGGSGGDGFYISGNGQFMGFFYPDKMKGEKGEVKFTFVNDEGKEITWKKTITLK